MCKDKERKDSEAFILVTDGGTTIWAFPEGFLLIQSKFQRYVQGSGREDTLVVLAGVVLLTVHVGFHCRAIEQIAHKFQVLLP